MPSPTWSDRIARAFAILRGAMLILFCIALVAAPEQAMPGSSTEPARSLALVFASRTILLGVAFIALALLRQRSALAWVFFADAALQVFDTGLAIAMHKGAVAAMPALIGILDAMAGRALRNAARSG